MAFNPQAHMTNLKGKDYLEVKWRLVWFRDEHRNGSVTTEVLGYEPLLVKAYVYTADGVLLATGHASAVAKAGAVWSGRDIEKAETAAIGRALGHAGYGTQFEPDDEGDFLADAPVEKSACKATQNASNNAPATTKVSTPAKSQETPQEGDKRTFTVTQLETALTKDDKPYYRLTAMDNTEILTFSRDLFRAWGWENEVIDSMQESGFKIEIGAEVQALAKPRKDGKGLVWMAVIPELSEIPF